MKRMVLDIGGTAMKSAIFEDGTLTDIRETPTEAMQGGHHVMNVAKTVIASYKETYTFEKIGISTAGQVNPVAGRIIYANQNIPGYTGMEIREIFEKEFSLPVMVENDVNAAALGEAVFGSGRGLEDFVCLTYGTGVGGAMILRNRLYSGSSFSAGEFGAVITHPEDYNPSVDYYSGCYEKYASATALVHMAQALDPSIKNGREVFSRMDEPEIKKIIDRWIMEIIYGLVNITHMLNPAGIILGGGVMEQSYVLENVQSRLYHHIMPSFRHVKVLKASLGNRAGMLGAAVLDKTV